MKNTSVVVAFIAGVSLIVSAALVASAIKEYGRSLERAAANQPRSLDIPNHYTVSLESGSNPVRFDVHSRQ